MALVIFNIGWMIKYEGQTPSDRIVNGGRYVTENKRGGEVENFRDIDGWFYGYVQPPGHYEKVNLERLGGAPDATHVDGVTIVFTATPRTGRRVVVGWYRNARVWRDRRDRGEIHYFAKARVEDCTRLELDRRGLHIPRANKAKGIWGMGRSNIRYVDRTDESEEIVRKLRAYVLDPLSIDLPPRRRARGNGPRQPDPLLRTKVEKAAINHVIDHYKGKGFEWDTVEKENKGWDLEFRLGESHLLVEVKGCSGDRGQVELTPNEYAQMLRRRGKYRLAIVTRALDHPQLSIVRYNESDETWCDRDNRKVRLVELTGVRVTCR